MGKRAAAPAGAAWKRQRGTGPKAKATMIAAALQDSNLSCDATAEARAMLAAGAATALCTVVENRHPMQDSVSGYIKEAINEMMKRLVESSDEAKAAVTTAEAELEVQIQSVTIAEDELVEVKGFVEAKTTNLDHTKKELTDVTTAAAATELEELQIAGERESFEKDQAKYKSLEENLLKALVEKGAAAFGSEKEAKKNVEKLGKELTKLGAEPALLAAAPPVLMKAPEERQGFDSHVLESMQGCLTQRLEDLAKSLEENAQKATVLAPDVASKKEAIEKATAARDAAQSEFEVAENTVEEKQVNVATAKSTVEATNLALETKRATITSTLTEVEAFTEVIQAYEFLAARSSKAPEPEEVATETAEAAAPETEATQAEEQP